METSVAEEVLVGTIVKATFIPMITGSDQDTSGEGVLATGQNVTVTKVNKEFDGKITSLYADFSRGSYTVEYKFTEWETLDQTTFLPIEHPLDKFTPEELKASLLAVQKQYSDEQAKNVRLETEFYEFKDAAFKLRDVVGDKLIEESNNRGWCDEFDRIISEVNEGLRWDLQLPIRQKTYNVTYREEFTVVVERNMEVTAASEEDAIEQAKNEYDCADTYDIKNAVDCGNWTFIDSDDYEAEES
jgi:hypothetical protein